MQYIINHENTDGCQTVCDACQDKNDLYESAIISVMPVPYLQAKDLVCEICGSFEYADLA